MSEKNFGVPWRDFSDFSACWSGGEMKYSLTCATIWATAVLAGASAGAAESGGGLGVCVDLRENLDNSVLIRARAVTGAVFAAAGVRLEWLAPRACRNAAGNVIHLEMEGQVPAGVGGDTLGYAMPYGPSGTAIHIFYRRVLQEHRDMPVEALGHVMAHEIGHVLEGVARHSPDGLMKAHWDRRDYSAMQSRRLTFAAEDVELMHSSLPRFSAAVLTARPEKE
jgi:hypothetical protein